MARRMNTASWWRYYALYVALIAPLIAVDLLLINSHSPVGGAIFMFVAIFTCMHAADRLEKRWWPRG